MTEDKIVKYYKIQFRRRKKKIGLYDYTPFWLRDYSNVISSEGKIILYVESTTKTISVPICFMI